MFKKDKFLAGALLGLIPPALAWFIIEILKFDAEIFGKKHLLYIASVVINLLLLRYFFLNDRPETARGVIFSTFISALLFVILSRIN
ncbi:stationary phase survival protein SurE [Flavihumibacter sp. R14]|nr:stationary phase survival protein SurE [Flavihumibacter soli]